jgi:hypothetical protein
MVCVLGQLLHSCGSSLVLTSFVYICLVSNIINYQLQNLHYQKMCYQQLVDNQNSTPDVGTYPISAVMYPCTRIELN